MSTFAVQLLCTEFLQEDISMSTKLTREFIDIGIPFFLCHEELLQLPIRHRKNIGVDVFLKAVGTF